MRSGAGSTLNPAEQALVADLVADGLSIQEQFHAEPLYKQTGKGRHASDTVDGLKRAKQSSPKGDNS
jgi:hypothetical protein